MGGTYSWREVCVRFRMDLHTGPLVHGEKFVLGLGWNYTQRESFCETLQACQLILFFFYSRKFEGFPWSLALGQSTIKGEWSSEVIDNCMDALEFSFKTFIYRAAEYDTMVPPVSTNLFLIYLWVRKAIVKRTLKQKARGDLVTWAACISQVRYKMYKTFIFLRSSVTRNLSLLRGILSSKIVWLDAKKVLVQETFYWTLIYLQIPEIQSMNLTSEHMAAWICRTSPQRP